MFTRPVTLIALLVVLLSTRATSAADSTSAQVHVTATIVSTATAEVDGAWARTTGPIDAAVGVVRSDTTEWIDVPPDAWTQVLFNGELRASPVRYADSMPLRRLR